MKTIDLAVIIPTLNEEHYIGKLLDCLIKQTVLPKEIVIVDATSKDKTIEEIQKRQKELPQLKYFVVPKSTISRQRNMGVEKTTAPYILFVDADMTFHHIHALEHLFTEAVESNADFAIPKILPESKNKLDAFLYMLQNGIPKAFKKVKALATTQCLFVKREMFEKTHGFDEAVKVGEDFDLVERMEKEGGTFGILNTVTIYSSVRRLEKDGRIRFVGILGISLLLVLLLGHKKNPIHKTYDFGKHPKV